MDKYSELKLEIFESAQSGEITESEKDRLLKVLNIVYENTAYNKKKKINVSEDPFDPYSELTTNSKKEGKYIAKRKAQGATDDELEDDLWTANSVKNRQIKEIKDKLAAAKFAKQQRDINDPKKSNKYSVYLTGNGAEIRDKNKEKIKELKKKIEDKNK